ncbi:MAG TPA: hypothetical protein VEG27_10395 [Usitatibacter sp.]|nr:hypothetical protein [Usitatibacter sp.]
MKTILAASAGVLALALALPAGATALPEAQTENGITYVSGGIGHDEATAMRAAEKNYPLSLVFSAGKDNEFLADLKVQIKNKEGKVVLSEASQGPIMLVKLPAGRYTLEVTRHDGKTEHRTVEVTAMGHRQVAFHWPTA